MKSHLYHDVLGLFRNPLYQLTNRSALTHGAEQEVGEGRERNVQLSSEEMLWKSTRASLRLPRAGSFPQTVGNDTCGWAHTDEDGFPVPEKLCDFVRKAS